MKKRLGRLLRKAADRLDPATVYVAAWPDGRLYSKGVRQDDFIPRRTLERGMDYARSRQGVPYSFGGPK